MSAAVSAPGEIPCATIALGDESTAAPGIMPELDPVDASAVTLGDVRACSWRGTEGATVVQLDTPATLGRLRVNVNDGPVWDDDPERYFDPVANLAFSDLAAETRDALAHYYRGGRVNAHELAALLRAVFAVAIGDPAFVPGEMSPTRWRVALTSEAARHGWREWVGEADDCDAAVESAEAAHPGWQAHTVGPHVEGARL